MVTIDEAVKSMDPKTLRTLARDYLQREVYDLRDNLMKLSLAVEVYGGGKNTTELHEKLISRQKIFLRGLGLWNKEYDRLYEQALKGELDAEEATRTIPTE